MKVNFTPSEELTLTPDFYSSIVRHGSELITVLNGEGNYKYVSDSISTEMGYMPEDLLGTPVLDLVHPEDRPTLRGELFKLLYGAEKQISLPPFRYKAKNGKWHWLSCVSTSMLDNPHVRGIVTNSRDITSKMEALRQKRESQAYYKALFFNNPDLVFTLTINGQVEACNDAVVAIAGYTREDFPESHFGDFVLPEYRVETFEAFNKALAGQSCTFETCIRHHNGTKRHLSATLVPVVLEGRVLAVQCIAKDSTNEKEAGLLVKAQAQKLHNILESMMEGFFALDRAWRYSFGNTVFANFLGRSLDDLMHRNIWEEYPYLIDTQFQQKCFEVAKTKKASQFDEYFPKINTILRMTLSPFADGILVSFVDITEQLAAQEELRKLSLVASKTTNGVIITNNQLEIEWVNEAFSNVTGYTLEEVAGMRPSDFLANSDIDPRELAWVREQLAMGVPMRKEMLSHKKNGEMIWADVTISPIANDKGQIEKHVYIHTDITERKLDQEQLLKTTEHLYHQNQDLQQFNYIVSHNLRAPVANLIGLSSVLQKLDPNSARFMQGVQNLETCARRLDDVISDLNKILAVRSANLQAAHEMVSLSEVAIEVVHSLQHLLNLSGGRVVLNLKEDDLLFANRAYIYSILHNLVSNAIKYKSAHCDLLIELNSVRIKNSLQLSIKDNGSGMDLEVVKPHLFQLYKRFHSGPDGKGIGLYLVKMQMNAIGGEIEVESKPEQGTTFTLYFKHAAYGQ
ncbi:PAS domain S-box protein [Pontibacter sp. HSC-14F20]|uniref:PAS domain-containing sensor histidine kinase n=1 Tax=Pontibacter sp. HSC-14F20 TaxID=2864136 RepID=UPI001C72CBAF|nr:PAS domain-containing sensor histidine kinase [Pontibacter sp. HSC-14F20]MBX0331812.1 PAS domain S-box protein [Pontibacter sp. HSC-14F20]